MTVKRLLLHTIPPYEGGVPAKARILAHHLESLGWEVSVAWYATLGYEPHLVSPLWRPWSRPGLEQRLCWDHFPGWAVGCRFPELETRYYALDHCWRTLMAGFPRHVAVGGNVLVANRLVQAEIPHLLWCATPVEEDRRDRRERMSGLRRWLDSHILTPALQRQERHIVMESPVLMPVASYGRRHFTAMGRRADPVEVLPVPVDTDRYYPGASPAEAVIGFAGRLDDPRKNITLLLQAVSLLRQQGRRVRLKLAGWVSDGLRAQLGASSSEGEVEVLGALPDSDLPDFYRSLTAFVIPSWQEGLGIVGVQAIACGLPIVSTKCGGPEDYVHEGKNGYLVPFSAQSMAERLAEILDDQEKRTAFSAYSRDLAVREYGMTGWAERLAVAWRSVWGEDP